jgi:hypothetical protein
MYCLTYALTFIHYFTIICFINTKVLNLINNLIDESFIIIYIIYLLFFQKKISFSLNKTI